MNKDKRKALIQELAARGAVVLPTADDYVRLAGDMADAASQGRTDRWKGACTLAARQILLAERDQVTRDLCRRKVLLGLEAMTLANR